LACGICAVAQQLHGRKLLAVVHVARCPTTPNVLVAALRG
jgi:hypothetical protein